MIDKANTGHRAKLMVEKGGLKVAPAVRFLKVRKHNRYCSEANCITRLNSACCLRKFWDCIPNIEVAVNLPKKQLRTTVTIIVNLEICDTYEDYWRNNQAYMLFPDLVCIVLCSHNITSLSYRYSLTCYIILGLLSYWQIIVVCGEFRNCVGLLNLLWKWIYGKQPRTKFVIFAFTTTKFREKRYSVHHFIVVLKSFLCWI